jgi:acetylornithine deacetylase/succinyl-diaminopimelate desuccinylase-like protein
MTDQTTRIKTDAERAIAYLRGNRERHLAELRSWVQIPSIGADPAYEEAVHRSAGWLAERFLAAGLDHVEVIETSGLPTVIADWLHAGPDAPTVLIYGHHDVQPASKEDGWTHDPFDARVEGDRLWGRGATDDKGQLFAHVMAAEAWLHEVGHLPVNLKFVVEGEEEIGSVHFHEVLEKTGDRLKADLLIVSDSMMRGEDHPAITYSLRGLAYFLIDVQGPKGDLHSGTWGGIIWNPNEALIHIIATMKDPKTGRILIDGFYDDVIEPTDDERARLRAVTDPDDEYLHGSGASALFGEEGWSVTERLGIRPTLEVNGMWGGYTGEGSKTVIPKTAHAKVSCRLVADQDPERISELMTKHIQKVTPKGVKVDVRLLNTGRPVRADPHHPLVQKVQAGLEAAFDGVTPALVAEGGTIPAVADMQDRLGVVPILAGFGHRDENMHAPDETFRLKNLYRGSEASARILMELAR